MGTTGTVRPQATHLKLTINGATYTFAGDCELSQSPERRAVESAVEGRYPKRDRLTVGSEPRAPDTGTPSARSIPSQVTHLG